MSHALLNCRNSLTATARLANEFDQWGMTAASHAIRQVAQDLAAAIDRDEKVLAESEDSRRVVA